MRSPESDVDKSPKPVKKKKKSRKIKKYYVCFSLGPDKRSFQVPAEKVTYKRGVGRPPEVHTIWVTLDESDMDLARQMITAPEDEYEFTSLAQFLRLYSFSEKYDISVYNRIVKAVATTIRDVGVKFTVEDIIEELA